MCSKGGEHKCYVSSTMAYVSDGVLTETESSGHESEATTALVASDNEQYSVGIEGKPIAIDQLAAYVATFLDKREDIGNEFCVRYLEISLFCHKATDTYIITYM